MKKNGKIAFEEISGNVFADMGLDDTDELLTRSKLGHSVRMILEKKKLKQREISKLLEIKQPEVSNLMNGRYTLFSPERLFGFLHKLDRKVTVQVSRRRKNEPLQEVVLASILSVGSSDTSSGDPVRFFRCLSIPGHPRSCNNTFPLS